MLTQSLVWSVLLSTIFVYMANFIFIFFLSRELKLSTIDDLSSFYNHSFFTKLSTILFFFNLIGVPLTPGFFVKVNIFSLLILNNVNISAVVGYVLINFIFFYFYIRSIFKIIRNNSNKKINLNSKLVFWIIVYIIVNILYIFFWPFYFIGY